MLRSEGIMDVSDIDFFKVKTGGTATKLTAVLDNRSATLRPKLNFYNSGKAHIAERYLDTHGANLSIEIDAKPDTEYYVRVWNYNRGTDGAYTLTVREK